MPLMMMMMGEAMARWPTKLAQSWDCLWWWWWLLQYHSFCLVLPATEALNNFCPSALRIKQWHTCRDLPPKWMRAASTTQFVVVRLLLVGPNATVSSPVCLCVLNRNWIKPMLFVSIILILIVLSSLLPIANWVHISQCASTVAAAALVDQVSSPLAASPSHFALLLSVIILICSREQLHWRGSITATHAMLMFQCQCSLVSHWATAVDYFPTQALLVTCSEWCHGNYYYCLDLRFAC